MPTRNGVNLLQTGTRKGRHHANVVSNQKDDDKRKRHGLTKGRISQRGTLILNGNTLRLRSRALDYLFTRAKRLNRTLIILNRRRQVRLPRNVNKGRNRHRTQAGTQSERRPVRRHTLVLEKGARGYRNILTRLRAHMRTSLTAKHQRHNHDTTQGTGLGTGTQRVSSDETRHNLSGHSIRLKGRRCPIPLY